MGAGDEELPQGSSFRFFPLSLLGLWAESTGPTELNRLRAEHQPSPPCGAPCPHPVLSVLRVSTLGRSTLGPRPRSSLWCLTRAPPTSGCPLSTARVTPAVSDPPCPAHPSALPATVSMAGGKHRGKESLLGHAQPRSTLPNGHRLGRCANHRLMYKAPARNEGTLLFSFFFFFFFLALLGAKADSFPSWVLSFSFYKMGLQHASGSWENEVRGTE